MIISELNMLLLAKDEMYNIDGFTKSNIDTFIKLIATVVNFLILYICFVCTCLIFYVYCIYLCIVYHFVYDQ